MSESKSLFQIRWAKFKKSKLALVAGVLLLVISAMSLGAEMLANNKPLIASYRKSIYFPVFKDYYPSVFEQSGVKTDYRAIEKNFDWSIWPLIRWNPYESNQNVSAYPSAPSKENILGTDNSGRDVAARLLYGFRYSLGYAVMVWLLSLVIAIIVGGAMGYFASSVDLVGQRIVEIIDTIPVLFLLLILVSIFKPGLTLLVLMTSLFSWILFSRYIRAEFLKLRNQSFVEVARALGAGHMRIIFKHILPNSLTPIITLSPFVLASHFYGLNALDFLGFGLPPPTPSWGELLSQAKSYVTTAWWLALYPSLALFLTLSLLTFLGNGVRKAFE